MTAPQLSVVIVSWNSGASLPASLGALRRSAEAAGSTIEVVVVDNASTDDSRDLAARHGVDVIVANPLNAGYVVAASQGISRTRGSWVMLANPDLTVAEEFVASMLDATTSVPADVACLVPDIRYAANPSVVNSRGIEVDAIGIPAESEAGTVAAGTAREVEVFGPSTSGCIVRRSALEAVGGLEPLYFAYLEDVDLGWRLRKRGYRSLLVPGAVAQHQGSVSTGEGSWLKAYLVARNRRVVFRLHGPRTLTARMLRAVTEIGHATVQAASGSGTGSVRGRAAALSTRSYTRFLRLSGRAIDVPERTDVRLAPRRSLADSLRRKRAAESLMSRGEGLATESRRQTRAVPSARRRAPELDADRVDRPLRVLVDATNLKPGQGGIRTYTMGLIEALADDDELALVVATSLEDVSALGPLEVVPAPTRTQGVVARAAWRERNLPALVRSLGADVVLSPVPELPFCGLAVPSAIVVHDVGPLVAPAFYSLPKKLRYQAFLPRTCRRASAIVCVSRATLAGLCAATDIDPRRCVVIGEGPQELADPPPHPSHEEPYFLYVGSLDPRKNVETLVDGLALTSRADTKLLIVGPTDVRASRALTARLERLDVTDRVRHLGFVDPERLSALYAGAQAVVLPSLYEGFGLPVLEAMRFGTPVVASDIPPVREVAGDAGLLVSRPLDPVAWKEVLERISDDAPLREQLARRGVAAAEQFTWAKVGSSFAALLRRVVNDDAGVPASVDTAPASVVGREEQA